MIENLCVAAEVVVGLLLVSLFWDGGIFARSPIRSTNKDNTSSLPAEATVGGRLRFFVWRWAGSLAQNGVGRAQLEANRGLLCQEFEDEQQALPANQRDALTHLLSRKGLEEHVTQIRNLWKTNAPRLTFCLLKVDQYDLMNSSQGRMFCDLALRHVGGLLHAHLGHCALVARCEADRFLTVFVDWDPRIAQGLIEMTRAAVAEKPFQRESHQQTITLSSSLVAVRETDTLDAALPVLMAGMQQHASEPNTGCWRDGANWCAADSSSYRLDVLDNNSGQSPKDRKPAADAVDEGNKVNIAVDEAQGTLSTASIDGSEAELAEGKRVTIDDLQALLQDGSHVSTVADVEEAQARSVPIDEQAEELASKVRQSEQDIELLLKTVGQGGPQPPFGPSKKIPEDEEQPDRLDTDNIEAVLATLSN